MKSRKRSTEATSVSPRKAAHRFGPTQKDIADALGVSQSTVAFALSGTQQHKLLPETVARVKAKVKELGYRTQRHAMILRKGRSHTIGAVFRTGLYHASQERVKFLAQEAIEAGYQLVALDLDWFGQDELAAQDYLLGAAVEGLILCNLVKNFSPSWEQFMSVRALPVVALSSPIVGVNLTAGYVQADMQEAFRELTEEHLRLGSQRLSLLLPYHDAGNQYAGVAVMQRVNGFAEAVRAAGGEVITEKTDGQILGLPTRFSRKRRTLVGEVIYPVKTADFNNAFELGQFKAREMIQAGTLPASLVCSNDQVATGALSAAIELGVDVPGKLLISGADDAPFSPFCGVPLTTIQQPSREMARWSVQRIIEKIENPELHLEGKIQTFPCKLIHRRSTARYAKIQ
ncbi:MAG TPA: LacI family DNA-binding transcriptional regulator [Chthoniobacteraceae bacterium]|nr:LacI family DNA-binding transcriptional regulator [Chthoniobacteraceae bacterium]